MDITTILKALPFLAPFAAVLMFWSQIQALFHKIFNLFVVEVDLQAASCEAMCHYLLKNTKPISFGFNSYVGYRDYLKPLKKEGVYALKKTQGQSGLFWYKGNFIYMNPANGEDKKTREYHEKRMKLFIVRGTINPDELVEKAMDEYNEHYAKYSARFCVNIIAGMGNKTVLSNDNGYAMPQKTSNAGHDYYFNKLIKYKIEDIGYGASNKKTIPYVFNRDSNMILNDVKKWKESEKWYRERGILWSRGTLCHGISGSGKTAAIRATAQMLDLPIYTYDLASLSNLELINAWKEMLSAMPCIAVFEDIDAVFDGRKNIVGENGGGLSFDCLLNVVGGTLPAEGVYTFVTTNHVEKLDSALGTPDKNGNSSRNGRLDNMIKMDYLTHDCKIKIANRILENTSLDKNQFINISENVTAARFVELCSQAAINDYWSKKHLTFH